MKDGSHFGSPLNLIFTNNIVRNMEAEAVHQYDDPYMATTASAFLVPAPNGTPVLSKVFPVATTFRPGQLLNYRQWFTPTADPTNVFMQVVSFDPTNNFITLTNPGLTTNVVGQLTLPRNSVYLSDYNPTEALIAGNLIENAFPRGGLAAITSNAKTTIQGNTIIGFSHGVMIYENPRNPLHPPTAGMVIDSNVILTQSPLDWPFKAVGALTYGPGERVINNLIITPLSRTFTGIISYDNNPWIEGNTIIANTVTHYSYDSGTRSIGIAFTWGTTGGTAAANRTRGMDVGVGAAGPYDVVPHRVILHQSRDDVLPVDPLGLLP
jgi:hypothetical protein